MTKVWAHRGASAYAPENTLEAFSLAAQQGADGVELDVQLTKDGKLVVAHDETIDRVSNGSGRIIDHTLDELKAFVFNKTHPEYAGARIPTLREVYQLLAPTSLTINVELKTGIVMYPGIEKKVLKLAEKMGMEDRVIYSSFHHQTLLNLKKLDEQVKTGILYSDGWLHVVRYARELGVEALHPALYHMQDEAFVRRAQKRGLQLHVWTVNRREDMERLVKLETDAIITNCPDVCRRVVDGMTKKKG